MEAQSQKNSTKQASKDKDSGKGGDRGGDDQGGQKKFFIQRVYDAFFAIMVELLKSKQISKASQM